MSDPHVLGPDLAPTPFTADEIRAGCPDGHRAARAHAAGRQDDLPRDTFGAADEDGCELTQVVTDASGTPVDEPRVSRVTWSELQSHAAFPAAATTVARERIPLAVGERECLRYDVRRGGGTSTFWFALDHPGMPLRYESAGAAVEVVAID